MPVSDRDLMSLASTYDIIELGLQADEVRRRLHGAATTFVRVADVPADPGESLSWPAAAGEIRIAGMPADRGGAVARAVEVLRSAGDVPVSAFSLADLAQLAARDGTLLRSVLEELRAVGLELIADAPLDRLGDPRRAIEDVNIAGLVLARLTVHQPPQEDIASWLKRVRGLQDAVGVIRAFAPLARAPNPAAPTTGFDDVKRVALARLALENVPHIQVDWALYGPKLAQVALTVGADDVDSVSPAEEGPEGPRRSPLAEIRRNILAAGLEPVERNARFERRRPD